MPKFAVDVKAFINVEIEAKDEQSAREAADHFVETLSPTDSYITGYNSVASVHPVDPVTIHSSTDFAVDGESDVEELD